VNIRFIHQYFFPDFSSVSQVISQIAFDLAEKNHDVSVICSRNKYDEGQAGTLRVRENLRGVNVQRCWGPSIGRNSLLGRFLDMGSFCMIAAARLMFAPKADVVVFLTNPPFFSLLGIAAKRIRKEHFVYILMDVYPDVAVEAGVLAKGGIVERILRWIARLSLREADLIVVLGEDMHDVVVRSGAPQKKVVVIRNWADPKVIYPVRHEENHFRREWGLEGKFVVEYSGNLGVSHFFEDILAVAEELAPLHDLRFLFIGGGKRFKEVEQFALERNLPNIILMPYREQSILSQSLSVGDVHYVSLRPGFEGLVVPSKAYGIMAAGRPIIYQGNMGGEIARMVVQEGIGHVVLPGDRKGLKDAVLGLYHDKEIRDNMGRVARVVLEKKYSSSIGLGLYREALTGTH
jgi:colanic acid biosynthesis glycosyl transferase WcaI